MRRLPIFLAFALVFALFVVAGGPMTLRKGTHVKTLTNTVGRQPRRGVVERVDGDTVEVKWADGHTSILSGGALIPDRETQKK